MCTEYHYLVENLNYYEDRYHYNTFYFDRNNSLKKIDIFIAEQPADTTEESSPAVEEEGQNEKDSTAGPETTATTTTTTTTPACEPTDHWKISSLIVG